MEVSMTDKTAIVDALNRVLGNTYVLYMKTHSYHWNVTGPQFHSLHNLFEEQYRQMWASLDDIAERIRTLGANAPGSSKAIAAAATLTEGDNDVPSATTMLKTLVADHEAWIEDAHRALSVAEGDTGTEDLLAPLVSAHEKMAWMLKSSIGE
jgi:starvation-inducible DNA-binding protein